MFTMSAMVLCCLLAAVSPVGTDTAAPPRPISEFKPSLHGFKFVNSFSGSPLPIKLGGLERAIGVPQRFGLCGGMSFAAADYFLAQQQIPALARPPADGTPLYKYISTRQADSLGEKLAHAPRFAHWMRRADDGFAGTRELTLAELAGIESAIADQKPAHLGLVFSSRGQKRRGSGGATWENHQVLCYAVRRPSPMTTDLCIYDPNYPGSDDAVIRCTIQPVTWDTAAPLGNWRIPIFGATCERIVPRRSREPVRGVFAMNYTPRTPPETRDQRVP